MRGSPSTTADTGECTMLMPFTKDFHDEVPVAAPTENARGAVTSSNLSAEERSVGYVQNRDDLNEKMMIAPPLFIFQKTGLSMKRRAERWEEEAVVVGVSPSKRVRLFTYPSPRIRNDSSDNTRRVTSTFLSLPPPPPPVSQSNVFMSSSTSNKTKVSTETVAPLSRVRRSFLRPALLLAPQPWNISRELHLPEVSYQYDNTDICSITTHQPSSSVISNQTHRPKAEVSTSEKIQFVFGENMSERVLRPQKTTSDGSESDCSTSESESSSSESAHKAVVWGTLRESAAAYSASCGRHRLFRRVQLFTGEEKESNVVQLTCRLFVLERGTQSWSERGRGVLRLNDLASGSKGCLQSRIVMRHQGSLKVILNTKLWSHTHLHRPARRNLQLTATDVDGGALRVFLIQAGVRDVARLYVAIHHRLVALRCGSVGLEAENTGGRTRDELCNSENEEEGEEEEEEEERQRQDRVGRLYLTRLRPVVCDRIHSKSSLGSR